MRRVEDEAWDSRRQEVDHLAIGTTGLELAVERIGSGSCLRNDGPRQQRKGLTQAYECQKIVV